MDWNKDGKKDILAGEGRGIIQIHLNIGSNDEPKLAAARRVEADGKRIEPGRAIAKEVNGELFFDKIVGGSDPLAKTQSKIRMADWDDDGLMDLLVGHTYNVILYRNVGKPNTPKFLAPVKIEIPEGRFPSGPGPFVVDWDGDGKKDLLTGNGRVGATLYRNIGTAKAPKLAEGEPIELKGKGFEKGYRNRIDVTDWNNDGKLDILVGSNYNYFSGTRHSGGNIWLFLAE